jgi:hypothetical protein
MGNPLIVGPGVVVEDLAIATGQRIQGAPFYDVDPEGRSPSPIDRALENVYGVDLAYPGDLVVRGSGDLERTTGIGALLANFARALITTPGELFWRPTYGVGATEFLNLPVSAGNIAELKNRIRRNLSADPAVEQVDDPVVSIAADGSGLIEIDVFVRIAGHGQRFQLAIRRT